MYAYIAWFCDNINIKLLPKSMFLPQPSRVHSIGLTDSFFLLAVKRAWTSRTSVYTHCIFSSADGSVVSRTADGMLIVAVQAAGCRSKLQFKDVTTVTFIPIL